MAIEKIREIKKYTGVSGDTKHTTLADGSAVPPGSKFHETNTNDTYNFVGGAWVLYKNLGGELWL